MSIAFTFPGQGSQHIGMGKELADTYPVARAVFDEADDALDQKLSSLMWDGPLDELTLTENTQPALLTTSIAIIRVLTDLGVNISDTVKFAAGHSLGEYSALAAVGALSLADAVRLVRTRGLAMQKAVPVGEGAMAALLGLDFDDVVAIAEEAAQGDVCQVANDNSPGQVVISGSLAAVDRAIAISTEKGAKRAVKLPVSAPFHCSMMAPVADIMGVALAETEIRPPRVPIVANVSAKAIDDPAKIRTSLIAQVTGTVRWRESVAFMASNGVDTVYELGAGKVLTGLARRIDRNLKGIAIGIPADIEGQIDNLRG